MLVTTTSCKKARDTVTYKAENGVSQTSSLRGRRQKGEGRGTGRGRKRIPLPISLPPIPRPLSTPATQATEYKIYGDCDHLTVLIIIIVINLL